MTRATCSPSGCTVHAELPTAHRSSARDAPSCICNSSCATGAARCARGPPGAYPAFPTPPALVAAERGQLLRLRTDGLPAVIVLDIIFIVSSKISASPPSMSSGTARLWCTCWRRTASQSLRPRRPSPTSSGSPRSPTRPAGRAAPTATSAGAPAATSCSSFIVVRDDDVVYGGNAWPANAKAQRIYNERKGT